MADQQWRTVREIEAITGDGQASISARLRTYAADEYLKQFFTKERRRRGGAKRGIFEHRILRKDLASGLSRAHVHHSNVPNHGSITFQIIGNPVDCFQNTIKELLAQALFATFVPRCRFLHVGLRRSGEADDQRGVGCLRALRIPAIASRASTAVLRSLSNVASRSSMIRSVC